MEACGNGHHRKSSLSCKLVSLADVRRNQKTVQPGLVGRQILIPSGECVINAAPGLAKIKIEGLPAYPILDSFRSSGYQKLRPALMERCRYFALMEIGVPISTAVIIVTVPDDVTKSVHGHVAQLR